MNPLSSKGRMEDLKDASMIAPYDPYPYIKRGESFSLIPFLYTNETGTLLLSLTFILSLSDSYKEESKFFKSCVQTFSRFPFL